MRAGWILLALAVAPAAMADKVVEKKFPLAAEGRVSIDTYKGSVNVSSWDRQEVEVYARIQPDGITSSDDAVKATEINMDASPSSVRVKTDYSRIPKSWSFFGGNQPEVHYRIKVPRTATVRVKDYKSKVVVSDLGGDLEMDCYKCEMELRGLRSVRLNTYKGTADVRFDRLERRSTFDTYKGDVRIEVPRATGFSFKADLERRANLRSDFGVIEKASDGRRRGTVNGGGAEIYLKSQKGEFELRSR